MHIDIAYLENSFWPSDSRYSEKLAEYESKLVKRWFDIQLAA